MYLFFSPLFHESFVLYYFLCVEGHCIVTATIQKLPYLLEIYSLEDVLKKIIIFILWFKKKICWFIDAHHRKNKKKQNK